MSGRRRTPRARVDLMGAQRCVSPETFPTPPSRFDLAPSAFAVGVRREGGQKSITEGAACVVMPISFSESTASAGRVIATPAPIERVGSSIRSEPFRSDGQEPTWDLDRWQIGGRRRNPPDLFFLVSPSIAEDPRRPEGVPKDASHRDLSDAHPPTRSSSLAVRRRHASRKGC